MLRPSKRKILLVDDEPSIREVIALLLSSSGYDVSTAEDGFAALEQLSRRLPDVIVSDLNMPQMSGYELLSVVRRRFPQILSVAMSGAYQGNGVPTGVIADSFYAKGESPGKLLATIWGLVQTSGDRTREHQKEVTPAWIPRNGFDSHGVPYVIVSCAECLRAFQLVVVEERTGVVLEAPCRYCPGKNRYIIEPLSPQVYQRLAS
jgi:CheY-like chemotaxis protein